MTPSTTQPNPSYPRPLNKWVAKAEMVLADVLQGLRDVDEPQGWVDTAECRARRSAIHALDDLLAELDSIRAKPSRN